MPLRAPKTTIRRLKEIRRLMTFEPARFGGVHEARVMIDGEDRGTVDEFVKAETRIYRESHPIRKIDRLIAWAEGTDGRGSDGRSPKG